MKTITSDVIMVYDNTHEILVNSSSETVSSPGLVMSRREGHLVTSYTELLTKVANISYHNPRFQLLFRGQSKDYQMSDKATASNLLPSILRGFTPNRKILKAKFDERFETLTKAENLLKSYIYNDDVWGSQIIRWAILQHYEVCPTPLLDLTSSVQSALSFAVGNRDNGWLYVLAFPHLTGGVSVSIETQTQIINLTQVCPPEALRPHFQIGYLASEYPAIDTKENSNRDLGFIGNNFSCRLLTKFKLENCLAWKDEGFVPIPEKVLFPNKIDEWYQITERIRNEVNA